MLQKERNGIFWLEFELFEGCPITHGSLLRHGGVSQGAYSTLNLSRTKDLNPLNAVENYQRLEEALKIPKPVVGRLCHGDLVSPITQFTDEPPISDGLSTNTKRLPLVMTQADCQVAIFYDPVHHAICNVHSGWRGSVQNIYSKAVKQMVTTYGSKPFDLLVAISPSLGPENSEFIHYKTELPESFLEFQIKPSYFDFWAISERQLLESGVLPHHIQIARIDTFLNENDYFSYRRNKECGRQATVCCLN